MPAALFPYARWNGQMPGLADTYVMNHPFPHLHVSNFLDATVVDRIIDEFARASGGPWIRWKHYNEHKSGLNDRRFLPATISRVIDELNSERFVGWLSELTGIPELFGDPLLEGGGMHACGRGGFLNVHADFTRHHHHQDWKRRINLIVYLNPGWRSDWGGALELWDRSMRRAVVHVQPVANDAIIFDTDEHSYHGFPEPLTCPDGVMRRSIALYYYTMDRSGAAVRSTNYKARPKDGIRRAGLIWADNQLVNLYSKVKSAFGLSDAAASRALEFLSKRKQ